jgi:hypothetical protein
VFVPACFSSLLKCLWVYLVLHLSDAPLLGRLLALPTNIRLEWKGLPGTNTAVYYKSSYFAKVYVPGRPFQPSLLFVGEARVLLSAKPFRRSTLG